MRRAPTACARACARARSAWLLCARRRPHTCARARVVRACASSARAHLGLEEHGPRVLGHTGRSSPSCTGSCSSAGAGATAAGRDAADRFAAPCCGPAVFVAKIQLNRGQDTISGPSCQKWRNVSLFVCVRDHKRVQLPPTTLELREMIHSTNASIRIAVRISPTASLGPAARVCWSRRPAHLSVPPHATPRVRPTARVRPKPCARHRGSRSPFRLSRLLVAVRACLFSWLFWSHRTRRRASVPPVQREVTCF
jgi:hypothetical protein